MKWRLFWLKIDEKATPKKHFFITDYALRRWNWFFASFLAFLYTKWNKIKKEIISFIDLGAYIKSVLKSIYTLRTHGTLYGRPMYEKGAWCYVTCTKHQALAFFKLHVHLYCLIYYLRSSGVQLLFDRSVYRVIDR